ncbi:hypothetical protein [Planobispora takensis]|uniref:hypothetical protein n=1 Tax=Planobispora takensis TaxID=1367882 RepID=UPI001945287B|nr:hypothetical protein [Planobispora takensis]
MTTAVVVGCTVLVLVVGDGLTEPEETSGVTRSWGSALRVEDASALRLGVKSTLPVDEGGVPACDPPPPPPPEHPTTRPTVARITATTAEETLRGIDRTSAPASTPTTTPVGSRLRTRRGITLNE